MPRFPCASTSTSTPTVKLLREQIDAAELIARLDETQPEPPDEAVLEAVRDLERTVLATVAGVDGPIVALPEHDGPTSGTVTLRLSLPEDLAHLWRQVEALYEDQLDDDPNPTFVAFLVQESLRSWAGQAPLPAYGDVYLRDRWRCASPVCRSPIVTPHHLRFRSQGGGEERANLLSLCPICHLELVHGARLAVTGQAPDSLHWRARGWARA